MLRVKSDDKVMVLTGKDRGKVGKVLRVENEGQRVVVEKINVRKRATRRTQQNQQGGFIEVEIPIHISNVALVDKKTNRPTRFGISRLKDGDKVRISKKGKEAICVCYRNSLRCLQKSQTY